jgi:two-component system, OmpR family, phosphate regulon sensor histidine kinase PhoR
MGLNETRLELENFVEYLPVGVIVFDADMRMSLWNDLGLKLLGLGVENTLSGDFAGLIDEKLLETIMGDKGPTCTGQQRLMVEKDGRVLSCTVKHGTTEDDMKAIVIVEDATKFRQIERIQRDFITNVLHKLRGPLSTLKTSLSMLQNGMALKDAAQTGEILAMSYHEVNRLVDLVNDLRDLFLIETGLAGKDLDIEDFVVSMAINRAADEIGKMPAPFSDVRQRILLTGAPENRVRADFGKTKKIFSVLLKNAILYSDGAFPIEASVSEADDCVMVCVRDKGTGIAEKSMPLLFGKYFREDTAQTRRNEGNGLGLFIAKSYADLMGGSIHCESVQSKGSAFFVSLPATRSE